MEEDAARWLLACVWSDHDDRRRRLEAAIHFARHDPPVVVRGDLVDDLSDLIKQAPSTATVVVFHSAVLHYVDNDRRRRFTELLAEISRIRPIVWISFEGPGVINSLEEAAPKRDRLMARLGKSTWAEGHGQHRLLALAHFHGWDLEWLE
jgi:hypothetical protein